MKLRTLLILAIALSAAAIPVLSQQVTVTGRKQTYTRPKPISGYKKTFSIRRPVVKAATPALSREIADAIDPVKVLDIRIREELTESQWLNESDFEVVFNERGMLTVMLWMEGSGAYSDGVTKYAVVDVEKGVRLTPADAFTDIEGLIAAVKKKQDAEVAETIKTIKANPEFGDGDPKQLFEYTDFKAEDLNNFAADTAGVAFFYDYGFPNVLKALEPEGELRLSWAEIKPFIRKDGLLARFVP